MTVPFYVPFSGLKRHKHQKRHLARAIRETALCRAVSRAVSTVPFCAVLVAGALARDRLAEAFAADWAARRTANV